MNMEVVFTRIFIALGIYLALGLLFSVLFLWKGLTQVDHDTVGSGLAFRLIILPGMLAFWPVFLIKWIKSSHT